MDMDERMSTGIEGFDEILSGGLIPGHSYLLVGAAGTGKTIASLQWLRKGERRGEPGLYLTLAEPIDNIQRNVNNFGWDLSDLNIIDLNPSSDGADGRIQEYSVFDPSEVERMPMWDRIYEAVRESKATRVVIDSVTQLRYLSADDYQFRKQVLGLVSFLHRHGCTSYLTYEPSELEHEASVALAVDGIIRLRMNVSPNRVVGLRSIQIEKLRGSDFISGYHPMRFTAEGIRVFPRRVEAPGDVRPGQVQLASGIEGLDHLLGGGLEDGTTTIVSGPAGAGKTTLGMQFLAQAVSKGRRAAMFTFEEAPGSIIARAEDVGIPAQSMIDEEMLEMVRVNPMQLYPDEFLGLLRSVVTDGGVEVLVVDSLRGYDLAMEEFGSPVANIHNMVTFLNRERVTTILMNETQQITGDLVATEIGVSYAVDNILLLRYAEHKHRVIKVIACLKKRHSVMETSLREFEITSSGITVSDPVDDLQGILTGAPFSRPAPTSIAPSHR